MNNPDNRTIFMNISRQMFTSVCVFGWLVAATIDEFFLPINQKSINVHDYDNDKELREREREKKVVLDNHNYL